MKTFAISTLGCKVNQYESQQIRQLLENLELKQVYPDNDNVFEISTETPDLIVINSCCVTQSASAKTRQYIHKSQNKFPAAIIVISGCLPTVELGELADSNKKYYLIKDRSLLAKALAQIVNDHKNSTLMDLQPTIKAENSQKIKTKNRLQPPNLDILTAFHDQTRAFLKVQDGCDGYCSYCIIPKTRPNLQSKPIESVLSEARNFVKAGHKEVVVTGIFLGAYGLDTVRRRKWPESQNKKLPELLANLAQIDELLRIRLSSLEPADVTDQLLDVFCQYPNIMPHLHLSLQSGSSRVLKKMGRQYSSEDFLATASLIKSRLNRPAITSDIIVGFPGETDKDFDHSINLAKEVGFSKIHVFPFSPRKGTAAAFMQNFIDKEVVKERAKQMRQLDNQLGRAFRDKFIGENARVLVEQIDGKISGKSERYFEVELAEKINSVKKNTILNIKLTKNLASKAVGKIL